MWRLKDKYVNPKPRVCVCECVPLVYVYQWCGESPTIPVCVPVWCGCAAGAEAVVAAAGAPGS